jgi:Ca2+-binding EF-hand superfamily protein
MKAEGVDDQLKRAYGLINKSGNGGITAEELTATMKAAGQNLSAADIDDMMTELGDGSGTVQYKQFFNCMTKSETAPWPLQ